MGLNTENWANMYGDYLFSLAKYKLNDEEMAKDLVQETFFSAIRSKDGFRGESSEKTWLVRILNNKIIDHYRSNRKEIAMSEYLAATERSFNGNYFDLDIAGEYGHAKKEAFPNISGLGSDDHINQTELRRILHFCMEKLPPSLSRVFLMKHIGEAKAETICKECNISSANYWVILHRAKLLLRTCIAKNWFA